MKKAQSGSNYYFVDESGDPIFYDNKGNLIVGNEGCSKILILGFIETQNPIQMRRSISDIKREILTDDYFHGLPSISKTKQAFHAKDDAPEIRYLFFKLLAELEFRAQFIVARKIERVFRNNFQARSSYFYDHLISKLFENVLHRYQENYIYFAKRGSRERQIPLYNAIQAGINKFEQKWNTQVQTSFHLQAQTPSGEPCLSVIDYMNWAVYRAFIRKEMRFYKVVESHVDFLVDLYDPKNYPNNWYHRRKPFDIKKITPL
jgi:hypothetical protein